MYLRIGLDGVKKLALQAFDTSKLTTSRYSMRFVWKDGVITEDVEALQIWPLAVEIRCSNGVRVLDSEHIFFAKAPSGMCSQLALPLSKLPHSNSLNHT